MSFKFIVTGQIAPEYISMHQIQNFSGSGGEGDTPFTHPTPSAPSAPRPLPPPPLKIPGSANGCGLHEYSQCTRQTDVRRASSLNAYRGGGIINERIQRALLTTFKTRPNWQLTNLQFVVSCMELTLLIQCTAHAQVCLFLMCFRSQASTRVLAKLLVEYSINKLLG